MRIYNTDSYIAELEKEVRDLKDELNKVKKLLSKSQLRRINIQTGKPMDEQLSFIKDWDTPEEDKTWEKL